MANKKLKLNPVQNRINTLKKANHLLLIMNLKLVIQKDELEAELLNYKDKEHATEIYQ